ncbi:MAG: hypothetical protein ACRED7_11545 [Stellaceae bacterium]
MTGKTDEATIDAKLIEDLEDGLSFYRHGAFGYDEDDLGDDGSSAAVARVGIRHQLAVVLDYLKTRMLNGRQRLLQPRRAPTVRAADRRGERRHLRPGRAAVAGIGGAHPCIGDVDARASVASRALTLYSFQPRNTARVAAV